VYSAAIKDVLQEAQIQLEKVHLVLRDAASVMRATTNKLELESFNCFLHTIQLALNDGIGLAGISEKLKVARALVTHHNSSKPFQLAFSEWRKRFNLSRGLIQVRQI